MYLLVDNYDSFTYNVLALLEKCGAKVDIVRNDQLINADKYMGIVLSPGPSKPENAGETLNYIKKYTGKIPILGICLGMQSIAHTLGYKVRKARTIMHGKSDRVSINSDSLLFKNAPPDFSVIRYHSLVAEMNPNDERITAVSNSDGEVMALEDKEKMLFGIQFHPESFKTEKGEIPIKNFLDFCEKYSNNENNADIDQILKKIGQQQSLSFQESRFTFFQMMKGFLSETQIAAILLGLRFKGETAEEIAGALSAMNHFKIRFDRSKKNIIDTCGTGGSGKSCFNISSAVSIVLSSMGFPVVKHGNRAQTGIFGSADIMESLNIPVHISRKQAEEYFSNHGFAFLYAQSYHPALKHVGIVRRQLKVPTLFNILGPLASPTDPEYQIIGTPHLETAELLTEVVKTLNKKNIIIYSSQDGYDEVSSFSITHCYEIRDNIVEKFLINPADFFKPFPMPKVSNREDAEITFLRSISGGDYNLTNLIALNAALALKCNGAFPDMEEGFLKVKEHISTGRVSDKLKELAEEDNNA